jgi:DNA replication and repair protein RecF
LASSSELAGLLPTLLIYPNSYRLLDHGPKIRRQFIDWGLFHVEPSFYSLWKQLNRILKQRNSLIRQGQGYKAVEPWDCEFARISNEINRLRDGYLAKLLPIVVDLLARFVKIDSISFDYYRGWAKDRDLGSTLEQAYPKDLDRGYSYYGPQRADLVIKAADFPAHEVLSRGQQKLLVIAMKLAQGILLREWTDKTCVFLLDDITAELDEKRQKFVISSLKQLKAQVFMTLLDETVLDSLREEMAIQMFHVEHGEVFSAPCGKEVEFSNA